MIALLGYSPLNFARAPKMTAFSLLGGLVQSDLVFPELIQLREAMGDVIARFSLAETRPGWRCRRRISSCVDVGDGRTCRLTLPGIATYELQHEGNIVITPVHGRGFDDAMRLFALGPLLSMLGHQRGHLPIRGAAVYASDGAVVICGLPGTGKSTHAAQLLTRGYRILCDRAVHLAPPALNPRALDSVLPTIPRLKLWQDTIEALSIAPDRVRRCRPTLPCFHLYDSGESGAPPTPIPVKRIVIIGPQQKEAATVEQLHGAVAQQHLINSVDQLPVAAHFGAREILSELLAGLVSRIDVHLVRPRFGLPYIDSGLDLLQL